MSYCLMEKVSSPKFRTIAEGNKKYCGKDVCNKNMFPWHFVEKANIRAPYDYAANEYLIQCKSYENVLQRKSLDSNRLGGNLKAAGEIDSFTGRSNTSVPGIAHHIIPIQVIGKYLGKRNGQFNDQEVDLFDGIGNGIFLPPNGKIKEELPYHVGNHPDYSRYAENILLAERPKIQTSSYGWEEGYENVMDALREKIRSLGQMGRAYCRYGLDDIEDLPSDSDSEEEEEYE